MVFSVFSTKKQTHLTLTHTFKQEKKTKSKKRFDLCEINTKPLLLIGHQSHTRFLQKRVDTHNNTNWFYLKQNTDTHQNTLTTQTDTEQKYHHTYKEKR